MGFFKKLLFSGRERTGQNSVWGDRKMNLRDTLVLIMELMGTIAFAVSGAMVAIDRSMDIFGVWVLGVVTAVGGGILRDLIIGITPPKAFQHPIYVIVATVSIFIVFIYIYFKREVLKGMTRKYYDQLMLLMDSIGLGIFTVVGVNAGILKGYQNRMFLLIFLGTVTGVGGGVIRDVLAGLTPVIFRKRIYACASMAGAWVCYELYHIFGDLDAMIVASVVVVAIRYMAAHFLWDLPHIRND